MAWIRSGDDLLSLSPLQAVAKLDGRPIFITHGSADTRVSPSYAFDLAAAVRANGGTVEPWIVEGAEHTQAVVLDPAGYERRLDAFFATEPQGRRRHPRGGRDDGRRGQSAPRPVATIPTVASRRMTSAAAVDRDDAEVTPEVGLGRS